MGLLGRDAILQVVDVETVDVQVPEWGGAVRVRGLSGADRDRFEASIVEQRGRKMRTNLQNVRARLVALSVIDEQGQRLFADSDVRALGEKSAAALERVFSVAQRLSGLSDGDVEELAENFPGGQSDGFGLS